MRQIKFRAWFEPTKEMKYMDDKIHISTFLGKYVSTNSKLMQYTGLKDKNGTEIYEGDIVIDEYGKNKPSKPFIVGFIYGSFNIFKNEEQLENQEYSEYYRNFVELYHENRLKVIGNKFENPELLI